MRREESRIERVCVIGLGIVGYPTALHIFNHGFSTCGYDIDAEKLEKITEFPVFNEWSKVPEAQIFVVCVNTNWKNGPDISNVFDVCHRISKKAVKPLVCIESTVPVGTCRKLAELFNEVYLVHVPHRYWSEMAETYGVKQLRVIGALDAPSLEKAKEFYEALEIPLCVVSGLEVAEMIKITENAYRFVQITFVEELRIICEKVGIPFKEVRKGANTKWNVNLLEARNGIKGDCLPKDTRYLEYLGNNSPLLSGAIIADERYKKYIKAVKKEAEGEK